tara:strand:+ start:464 stop:652 length:189 start_codon:yes stop_codon:yes gene_type:complete
MGLVNASITFVIGYFIINFIQKNKNTLKKIVPTEKINKYLDKDINSETYLLLLGFVVKDFFI